MIWGFVGLCILDVSGASRKSLTGATAKKMIMNSGMRIMPERYDNPNRKESEVLYTSHTNVFLLGPPGASYDLRISKQRQRGGYARTHVGVLLKYVCKYVGIQSLLPVKAWSGASGPGSGSKDGA